MASCHVCKFRSLCTTLESVSCVYTGQCFKLNSYCETSTSIVYRIYIFLDDKVLKDTLCTSAECLLKGTALKNLLTPTLFRVLDAPERMSK